MAKVQASQTKVLESLDSKKLTSKIITDKIGKSLGSPVNGKEVGSTFMVTLTGKVEIREFQNNKGAYYTTKEGFSVKVNASFDPLFHCEGAEIKCVCRLLEANPEQGILRDIKYATFAD